jgi:hypothetical protein
MMAKNAEYLALERVITADKRFRKFMYVLVVVAAAAFLVFISNLSETATNKAAKVVSDAAQSNNVFSATVARENIRFTTCLLLVTIEERQKPEIQQNCFDQADLPGGLLKRDFTPFILELNVRNASTARDATPAQSSSDGVTGNASSSQPTLVVARAQPNNPQIQQPGGTPRATNEPNPSLPAPPQQNALERAVSGIINLVNSIF